MKYCSECASRLRNDAEFCHVCGAPCEDTADHVLYGDRMASWQKNRRAREKKERRTSPAGIIGTLLLLFLIAGAMFYLWYCPARRSCEAAANGYTEEAGTFYRTLVKGNEVQEFLLRCLIPRSASNILRAYEAGNITYPDASERLLILAEMELPLNNAARTAGKLERIFRSREAWSLAVSLEEKGDVRSAMLAYRMVDEGSEHYQTAMDRADVLENAYRSSVLSATGVPETVADYEAAREKLLQALDALPDDPALKNALDTLTETFALKIRTLTLPVAADYIEKAYYAQAIRMLKTALRYNEQDVELKTYLTRAVTNYETFVRSQVSICLNNGDRETALALIKRVRAELPDDVVFAQLEEAVGGG